MRTQQFDLLSGLRTILGQYQNAFTGKAYAYENDEHDLLMDIFSLTPHVKRENRQYWGRELGMCWQLLVIEVCRSLRDDFQPALRFGSDEPCDLLVGKYAIDTKYRIGSGDSGTLKKFRTYGPMLRERGYEPVLLVLRTDNLRAAVRAFESGQWRVLTGGDTLDFIHGLTGFDIRDFLKQHAGLYPVTRG